MGYPLAFLPTGRQRGTPSGSGVSHIPAVAGKTYGHPGRALSAKPITVFQPRGGGKESLLFMEMSSWRENFA